MPTPGPDNGSREKNLPFPSMTTRIVLGLIGGIACGLFFGDDCKRLDILGKAFVGLLQMTVLPYIAVTLVASVGRLTVAQAGRIVGVACKVMLLLWAIGFSVVLTLPWAFPRWESASFYSVNLTTPPLAVDWLGLFIPSNPFHSLAANLIPAVVVFCISLGAALIHVDNKATLLDVLDVIAKGLMGLNRAMMRLMPVGIFVISAHAAGTMSLVELERLQAYLLTYSIAVFLLTFGILPMLISACTPFRYRDVMHVTKDALLTVFATGKVIIVLPMLIEKTEELFERCESDRDNANPMIATMYPLAYPFPSVEKVVTLLFVPFVAWFVDELMTASDYPRFVFLGLVSSFAKPVIAIPFMLDTMAYPVDLFQLFLASSVYCERIGNLLGAMHLFTFSVLCTSAFLGLFKVRWMHVARFTILSVALLAIGIVGTRTYLNHFGGAPYDKNRVISEMSLLLHPSPSEIVSATSRSHEDDDRDEPVLSRIRRTKVLRVGFSYDNLPFSYRNVRGDLVGFDIDMAHMLARELECDRIEFIPVTVDTMAEQMASRQCDVIMSGVRVTTSRIEEMTFTIPYMELTSAMIVKDHRRAEFATLDAMRQMTSLRIGILGDRSTKKRIATFFPQADIVVFDTPRAFFEESVDLDAFLLDAERGTAWALLYPSFHVVVPQPVIYKQSVAYPVAAHDLHMAAFLSQWIALKKTDGDYQAIYDHWVLGKNAQRRPPRWSILRDVLHWTD